MHQDVRDDMRAWDMLEGVLSWSQYGAAASDWKTLLKVFATQIPSESESRVARTESGMEQPDGFGV